jgi:hypothetical protein
MGFHHHYVHGPKLIPRLMGSASGATSLLGAEADGLSIDFTDASLIVRDTTTTSNAWTGANGNVQDFWRSRSFTSYSSPSPKITRDSDGYYKYRPHNLLAMSGRLIAGNITKTKITATDAALACPSGETGGTLITEDNTSGEHRLLYSLTGLTTGAVYTLRAYVKTGTSGSRNAVVYFIGGTYSYVAYVNTTTGAIVSESASGGATGDATATLLASGWVEVVITCNSQDTSGNVSLGIADGTSNNYAGDSASNLYYCEPQLNAGPTALTYTKTQAHNLCLQSQTLNTTWVVADTTTTTDNAVAPDGTTTAERLNEANTTAVHFIRQSITVVAGYTYTVSLYAKQGTNRQYVQLFFDDGSNGPWAVYDVNAGTVTETGTRGTGGTLASTSITGVGNGWYRIAITGTVPATTGRIGLVISNSATPGFAPSYLGDTGNNVYLWGGQLELASSAGKYVTTTAAAVYESRYELPREWDSAGACQGLLVEEARTNLCLRNRDLSNATVWTPGEVSAAQNATGIDGVANAATTVTGAAGSALHRMLQNITYTAAVYTCSAFVKYTNHAFVQFLTWDGTAIRYANFNIQTGVAGNTSGNATSSITSVGNGWYRITMTSTGNYAAAAGEVDFGFISSNTDASQPSTALAGTENFIVDFVQVEAGAFVTSPIYTGSASVTRVIDNVGVSTRAAPDVNTACTIYAAFTLTGHSGANPRIVTLSDGTTNEFVIVDSTGATTARGVIDDGGVGQFSQTSTINTTGTANKAAVAVELNNGALAANGTANAADTSMTMPTVHTLHIGSGIGSNAITGYVRQVMSLPRRMSNADMQVLTT